MAFLDDRLWCHPKWADLSPEAWRIGVCSILYSHGFLTSGRLTPGQLRQIGAGNRTKNELLAAGIWERDGDAIRIHDYTDYNVDEERIEKKREQTRERVKRWRERQKKRAMERNGERHGDALHETPDNGDGNEEVASYLARARGSEDLSSEVGPLTPQSGELVTQTSRQRKANPRALGTNPRAQAEREKEERRVEILAAAVAAIADFDSTTSTVVVHDALDVIERKYGRRFTDQERGGFVDEVLGRSAP